MSVAVCAVTAAAFAQDAPEITRYDLGTAYLRFEQTLAKHPLTDANAATVNQQFDQATFAFFQQKFGQAVKTINELGLSLSGDGDDANLLAMSSLRASVEPPVYLVGSGKTPTLRVTTLYPIGAAVQTYTGHVVLVPSGEDEWFRIPFEVELGQGRTPELVLELQNDPSEFKSGRYTIGFFVNGNRVLESTPWTVVSESLDAIQEHNAVRLTAFEETDEALIQAVATCRARNKLLTDTPSVESTAQMRFDPIALAREVDAELSALERGENPYAGRTGDYWRVVKSGDTEIPFRVYLPPSAENLERIPVVVAFHGAGGDENMFMDAYGAGIAKDLAEEHAFMLISPLTYAFGDENAPEHFDHLLKALAADYPVDSRRIFVLGHSMGGGTTANMVMTRAERIAAAACLFGFRKIDHAVGVIPPTLVLGAEHDPIVQPEGLKTNAQDGIDRGLDIEFRLVENYGHTLSVGNVMATTVDWLLAKAE